MKTLLKKLLLICLSVAMTFSLSGCNKVTIKPNVNAYHYANYVCFENNSLGKTEKPNGSFSIEFVVNGEIEDAQLLDYSYNGNHQISLNILSVRKDDFIGRQGNFNVYVISIETSVISDFQIGNETLKLNNFIFNFNTKVGSKKVEVQTENIQISVYYVPKKIVSYYNNSFCMYFGDYSLGLNNDEIKDNYFYSPTALNSITVAEEITVNSINFSGENFEINKEKSPQFENMNTHLLAGETINYFEGFGNVKKSHYDHLLDHVIVSYLYNGETVTQPICIIVKGAVRSEINIKDMTFNDLI